MIQEWFVPTFRDDKGNARGFQHFGTLEAAEKWVEFWEPQPEIYTRWVTDWVVLD